MSKSPILIVEDDPASSDILAQLLLHNQFDVDIAQTGEEALEYLGRKEFALAVIDLGLPGINGWELLQTLQSMPETASMKTVALTAYYDPSLAKQARSVGFQACFPKPANQALVDDLVSIMSNPQ